MKIVSRLEDLCGLENGFGLRLVWQVSSYNVYNKNTNSNIYWFETLDREVVEVLKAMGFKIEYGAKRTFEEIMSEVEEIEFLKSSTNYYLWYDYGNGKWALSAHVMCQTYGTKYYNKEQLKKAIEELNS